MAFDQLDNALDAAGEVNPLASDLEGPSVGSDPFERQYLEEEAQRLRADFSYFIQESWRIIEPNELDWNWHLDLKAHYLQQVTEGEIQRLVILEPPGFAKSLVVSVMWPAWEWLRDPTIRNQYLSGSDSVRKRDSKRCRDLMKSTWYRKRKKALGLEWQFSKDQDQKGLYANTAGGERQSGVIGGKITGDRADKQVLDDPNDVKDAIRGTPETIERRMAQTVSDWDDVLTDRLNDEANDPRVLIMQRLHKSDLGGVLKERDGYEVVEIRQEFDPDAEIQHPDFDPRTEKGELAHPERLGPEEIEQRKKSDIYEATNNQNPSEMSGEIFSPSWFYATPNHEILDPDITYESHPPLRSFDFVAASWDFAGGTKSGADSHDCGYVYGKKGPKYYVLPWRRREQASYLQKKEMFRSLQTESGVEKHLIEIKSSGEAIYNEMSSEYGGCIDFNPTQWGSKTTRAQIASEPFETGDVYLPTPQTAPWIMDWVQELLSGIAGSNDRIDTWSQFVIYLIEIKGQDVDPKTTLEVFG